MKPAPFEYLAPDSLTGALQALKTHGYDAKLLAGGQSLVPTMNFRLAQPAVLIDINGIEALSFIRRAPSGELRLGALTRHYQLESDPLAAEIAPLIAEAMPHIAHPQIRNRGTLGGSLVHSDPAAELPALLLALNGRLRLQNLSRDRWVNADDFFIGLFETALANDEMLVEIAIPPMKPNAGYAFEEVARRHGDFALAGVAVVVEMDEQTAVCQSARLVYVNAGETPILAKKAGAFLRGKKLTAELMEETAVLAQSELEPSGDIHATVEFKRHLAKVLTVRALKRAKQRVMGDAG